MPALPSLLMAAPGRPPGYSDRVNHALAFAAKHHDREVRRGTRTPYFTAPASVAVILTRYGQPEDTVVAGVLQPAVEDLLRDGESAEAVRARVLRIGPGVFDEARAILRHEDYLLPPRDPWIVYREFAAVYLELKHFAARLLPAYFPSVHEPEVVDRALGLRVVVVGAERLRELQRQRAGAGGAGAAEGRLRHAPIMPGVT